MKVLIDPEWEDLASDLSTEEKSELLMCILGYPKRDCDLGLWRFIKKQLDKDAKKYKEKCARMLENGQNRWIAKSDTTSDMKSDTTLDMISKASSITSSITNTSIKKEKVKNEKENAFALGKLLKNFANEHRMDSETKFEIAYDFSFTEIMRRNSFYADIFGVYPLEVLQKAQDSIVKKRIGQKLTLQQLTDWIEQARKYYEQDQRGKL